MKPYKKPKHIANSLEGLLFAAYNIGRACDIPAFSFKVETGPYAPPVEIDILVSDIVVELSHWIFLPLIALESLRAYSSFCSEKSRLNQGFHALRWTWVTTACILACLSAEIDDSENFDAELAGLCANIFFILAWGGTALRYLGQGFLEGVAHLACDGRMSIDSKKTMPHLAIGTLMSLITVGAGLRYFGDGSDATLGTALIILLAVPIVQLSLSSYMEFKANATASVGSKSLAFYIQLACTLTYLAGYVWFASAHDPLDAPQEEPEHPSPLSVSEEEHEPEIESRTTQLCLMGAPVLLSTALNLSKIVKTAPAVK